MKQSSLTRRISWTMWMLSAIASSLALFLGTFLVIENARSLAKENILAAEANLVSLGVLEIISLSEALELDPRVPQTLESAKLYEIVRIYQPPGRLLFSNVSEQQVRFEPFRIADTVNRGFFSLSSADREYLTLTRPYQSSIGQTYWIQIATPVPIFSHVILRNLTPFIILFIVLSIFSFLVSRWVTSRSLQSLRQISLKVGDLRTDNFKQWQPIVIRQTPEEFEVVISKINEMIGRVQQTIVRSFHMGRYIAHEVRTPLTIIRGEIETFLMQTPEQKDEETKRVLQSSLDEVSRIEDIVASVLRLADYEKNIQTYRPESVSAEAIVRECADYLAKVVFRDIRIEETATPAREIFVDPELFQLLLSNLVRNIAKHTPKQTRATIRIVDDMLTSFISIVIEDNGPGMNPALLKSLQEQVIPDRAGVGLSLSYEIARTNHIDLSFENLEPHGLRVVLRCPVAVSTRIS